MINKDDSACTLSKKKKSKFFLVNIIKVSVFYRHADQCVPKLAGINIKTISLINEYGNHSGENYELKNLVTVSC